MAKFKFQLMTKIKSKLCKFKLGKSKVSKLNSSKSESNSSNGKITETDNIPMIGNTGSTALLPIGYNVIQHIDVQYAADAAFTELYSNQSELYSSDSEVTAADIIAMLGNTENTAPLPIDYNIVQHIDVQYATNAAFKQKFISSQDHSQEMGAITYYGSFSIQFLSPNEYIIEDGSTVCSIISKDSIPTPSLGLNSICLEEIADAEMHPNFKPALNNPTHITLSETNIKSWSPFAFGLNYCGHIMAAPQMTLPARYLDTEASSPSVTPALTYDHMGTGMTVAESYNQRSTHFTYDLNYCGHNMNASQMPMHTQYYLNGANSPYVPKKVRFKTRIFSTCRKHCLADANEYRTIKNIR